MKTPKRILVVDDHAFVRRAVRRMLEGDPDLVVCAEAETADQALQATRRHHPDLILLDLALRGEDGLSLVRSLRARNLDLPVLILTLHKESLFAESALRAGANGFLMKNDAPEHLIEAVHAVLNNRIYVSDTVRQAIFSKMRGDALLRTPLRPARRAARTPSSKRDRPQDCSTGVRNS
jgi:DNA-binding NarL/FixJ family response regulator